MRTGRLWETPICVHEREEAVEVGAMAFECHRDKNGQMAASILEHIRSDKTALR